MVDDKLRGVKMGTKHYQIRYGKDYEMHFEADVNSESPSKAVEFFKKLFPSDAVKGVCLVKPNGRCAIVDRRHWLAAAQA